MKYRSHYGKIKTYSSAGHLPKAEHVLVVPGFSETLAHNKKLVDALADQGFDASTYSQPRKTDNKETPPIVRLSNILLSRIHLGIPPKDKVHLLAHSFGAAAALDAAKIEPERIASVTLMEPAGMSGKQKLPEQINRVSRKVINNQALSTLRQPGKMPKGMYTARVDDEPARKFFTRTAKANLAGGGVIIKNPALALREAKAAGSYDMTEDVQKVTELGIPVHIVLAHDDEMHDYKKSDDSYQAGINPTSYSSVADKYALHDTFWLQPERTARIVGQLIMKS